MHMKPIDPLVVLAGMEKTAGSRKALAEQLGYQPAYLSDVMNGRRDVNDRMLAKIGLKRVVVKAK